MNIMGYYDAEDVWIPDPILHQREHSELLNEYKTKEEKKIFNDYLDDLGQMLDSNGQAAY